MNADNLNDCANRLIAKSVIEERLAIAATEKNIIALAKCISDLENDEGNTKC